MSSTKFLKIIIFLICLTQIVITQTCHYSCKSCASSSYIRCLSCADSSNKLNILQDPNTTPPAYRISLYPTGTCVASTPQGANGLGIILLIISIVGLLITQSYQAFFICSTLQTLALFGLIQIAWINPSSYILHAFQYFMPINIILSSAKHNDPHLLNYGFYRLDQFMISSQDTGLIAIFAIDCVLFVAIIGLFIFTLFRRRKQKELQNSAGQQTKNQIFPMNAHELLPQNTLQSQNMLEDKIENINEGDNTSISPQKRLKQGDNIAESPQKQLEHKQRVTLFMRIKSFFKQMILQCVIPRKVMHLLMYVFFFLVQQTALSIMVGAVFTIGALDVAIWIVYFIQLVTLIIISYYEFSVDKSQYNKKKQKQLSQIIEKQTPQQKYKQIQKWQQKIDLQRDEKFQFGLSLFISRQCMFILLVKKVVLPLGIVLPLNLQYIYFALYIVLFIIQGSFDTKSGRVNCFSRITLWKIFQMIITTLILSYFLNQKNGSTSSGAMTVNIILVIFFVVVFLSLIVQYVISFLSIFFGMKKIHNDFYYTEKQADNKKNMIKLNYTQQTIKDDIQQQKNEEKFQNVFERVQLTRQITPKNQKNEENKKIQIIDVDDCQNDHVEKNKINKDHMLVVQRVEPKIQPKVQPKIEPKIEPKVQLKVQPKIQPKLQVKTQPRVETKIEEKIQALISNKSQTKANINTLSQSNKGKSQVQQTIKSITHQEQQANKNNQDKESENQNDENNYNNKSGNKGGQNEDSPKKKKQKKKMRIMDPQLRKRYGLK